MQDNNTFQPNNSPQPTPPPPKDFSSFGQVVVPQNSFTPQEEASIVEPVVTQPSSGSVNGGLTLQPSPTFNQPFTAINEPDVTPVATPTPMPSVSTENTPSPFEPPTPQATVPTTAAYTPDVTSVATPVATPTPMPSVSTENTPSPFEPPTPQATAPTAPAYTSDVTNASENSDFHSKIAGNKSNKKVIALVATIVPLLLIGGGFGYYYFVMRTPNSAYAEAANQVNTMLTSTKSIASNSTKLPLLGDAASNGTDTTKLADQTLASINSYNSALTKLQSLDIVKNDKDIEKALSANTSKLTKYGNDLPDLIKTSSIIATLTTRCGTSLTQIGSAKSVTEFDTIASICTNYMQQNQTIPTQTLSAQYSGILALIKQVFDSSKSALQLALSGKLVDSQKAKVAADAAVKQLQQVQAELNKYKLETPADPKSELESLKKTITDRENLFFR